jgi:hypothetical protein
MAKIGTNLFYYINDQMVYEDQTTDFSTGFLTLGYHDLYGRVPANIFGKLVSLWPTKTSAPAYIPYNCQNQLTK